MEIWKDVLGFEGWYKVSNLGNIKRVKSGVRTFKNRLLKQYYGNKYGLVMLRKDGNTYARSVHRLVCEAFLGKRPSGMVIDHIDGNQSNNNKNNLHYVFQGENVYRGKRIKYNRTTIADFLKEYDKKKETLRFLSKKYNINYYSAWLIAHRKRSSYFIEYIGLQ